MRETLPIAQNLGVPSRTTRSRPGSLRVGWALAFAMALGLSAPALGRGDDAAEARRHAQRASSLAASGKCRQAVAEWNKAMAILHDPALLFNRAECYRTLGEPDAALADYRQFLSDLPKAPNRAQVERRIAELSAKKDKEKAAEAPRVAPAPAPAPGPVVAPPPPPPVVAAPPPVPRPAPEAAAPQQAPPPSPVPAAPAEAAPNPGLALSAPEAAAAPSSASAEGGITTRPWFWITIAAVAVAAGVGTFVILSRDSTNIPSTALGNYKF